MTEIQPARSASPRRNSFLTFRLCGVAASAFVVIAAAAPADALVINPIFDTSITSLPNAAVIESAFTNAASQFEANLSSATTVNINVSWGSVASRPLPSGDIGASLDRVVSRMAYTDITGYFDAAAQANPKDTVLVTADANLPKTDPSKLDSYSLPYAEAKALGVMSPNWAATDGYIGFKSGVAYDFNPDGGVAAGSYDFQGVAMHEIAEVLGRITGLQGTPYFATPFDMFRNTSSGVSSFSKSAAAYFSIDGGDTNLGNFNYTGGGDRSDWLSVGNDAQNAYFSSGKAYSMSASDWTALDALGWDATINAGGYSAPGAANLTEISASAVPEPATWGFAFIGAALIGLSTRHRRVPTTAPVTV